MKWIKPEEQLPEEHEDILVYYYSNINSLHFPTARYIKETSFYEGEFECNEVVTHWAKMPVLPTD